MALKTRGRSVCALQALPFTTWTKLVSGAPGARGADGACAAHCGRGDAPGAPPHHLPLAARLQGAPFAMRLCCLLCTLSVSRRVVAREPAVVGTLCLFRQRVRSNACGHYFPRKPCKLFGLHTTFMQCPTRQAAAAQEVDLARRVATFAGPDGEARELRYDLLVGADGVNSRVRCAHRAPAYFSVVKTASAASTSASGSGPSAELLHAHPRFARQSQSCTDAPVRGPVHASSAHLVLFLCGH